MTDATAQWERSDPFDLPDWLGEEELTWLLEGPLSAAQVRGTLCGHVGHELPLHIICADVAYPAPVVSELLRRESHLAWHHGQVLVVGNARCQGLAVPVSGLDADTACEALRRFAMAIAVDPSQVRVTIPL